MEIPLAGDTLHFVSMRKGIWMYLSHLNVIVIELDLTYSVLVIQVHSQQVLIHQCVGYLAEVSVIVQLSLHVFYAEV